MAAASILLTLPLGILLGSLLGAKLGARAVLRLLFPFPTIVYHLLVAQRDGVEAASREAAFSLGTVPMVFAWAIPFAWASRRVASPFVAFAIATAVSYGVHHYAPPAHPLVSLAITALAILLLRDPGPPVAAPFTPANLGGRLLSIVALLVTLAVLGKREDAVSAGVVGVLAAFPRMTMELTVGTWLAAGPVAARQVLSGLPIGLWAALVWCGGLVVLPAYLPDPAVLSLAGAGAIAVTAALAWTYDGRPLAEGSRLAG